jgi:ATP-dependent Clp protease ATP-binding subunit ClpC
LGLELSKKDVFGRAEESQEVLRVLARQKKNNVILVGEAGVGKKAIILAALKKISTDTGLVSFEGCHFVSLDIQALTPTGTEANIGKMLEQEILEKSPAIVFLENMETFKTKEQISVFVNFLYNLELKTKARFILSVGSSYYNQFLQTDPLISQNFELIKVPALTQSEVIKILGAVKSSMESFHKVKLDESVFPDLVSLSGRFLRDEALPQKAISLLEEAASDASISGRKEVSREDLLKIISQKSGVPMSSLTVSDKEKLTRLEEDLSRQVIGQPEAVKVVSEAIKRSRAGLKDPKKPIGSFLFLGPTGVGKTELAKALARTVFDSEKAFVRLDMSEYGEQHTTQRLIGSPPGYVGYEEGGQLTNPVMERPYCLILLDEIEKAHPKVFDVFLQVLDDGRLTDSQGRLADFKNTIIIATSNIGQDEILEGELERQNSITGGKTYDEKLFFEQKIMPKLKEHFRPEFINRFDDIIVFRALSKEDLKKIAKIKLSDVIKRLSERKINLSIKEGTLDLLAESSYDVKFGARPLVRKIREEVENTIANKVIDGNVKEGDTLEI